MKDRLLIALEDGLVLAVRWAVTGILAVSLYVTYVTYVRASHGEDAYNYIVNAQKQAAQPPAGEKK